MRSSCSPRNFVYGRTFILEFLFVFFYGLLFFGILGGNRSSGLCASGECWSAPALSLSGTTSTRSFPCGPGSGSWFGLGFDLGLEDRSEDLV
jgi:hypothetical protein